jgi:phospholipid-binding lipoprotein MlaA
MRLFERFAAAACLLAVAACTTPPADPEARAEYDAINDPAEPTNRAIFAANQYVDRHVLKPAASAYLEHVPAPARRSIHDFVTNLGEPVVLVNDVLQGNASRAWVTTGRFAIDTTLGVAGLFDPATDWGLPHHSADFGQTFGVWGVGPGPSVQIPLLGFSNLRDTLGRAVGVLADPMGYIPGSTALDIRVGGGGLGVVDTRADLLPATDSLEKSSLDYYAALRSLVAQRRAALVEEGRSGGEDPDEAPAARAGAVSKSP